MSSSTLQHPEAGKPAAPELAHPPCTLGSGQASVGYSVVKATALHMTMRHRSFKGSAPGWVSKRLGMDFCKTWHYPSFLQKPELYHLQIGTCHLSSWGSNYEPLQLTSNTPWKEFRVETRNEALCALRGRRGRGLAEQVFRYLDIFRKRFYEPNSCVSSYLEKQ